MVYNRKSLVSSKKVRNFKQRVLIGTLGVNCLEYTRRCIESVQTECDDVTFLYIDNGSHKENVERIRTWKKKNDSIDDFVLAFNGRNAGVAVGWNQIIRFGVANGFDKIIICNNDIAFGRHTIDGLVYAFDRLRREIQETVMVTATNHTKNPAQLKDIQQVWNYSEHPDFSCFMITPEFVERIGYISEMYEPAFFEDNDTHWRILMTGWKAFSTDWAPYSHIASRTRHENPNIVTHLMFRENKIKFFREMLTDTVDQSVPDARYQAWLKEYPDVKHPSYTQVRNFTQMKLVEEKMFKWLEKLSVYNLPQ